MMPYLTCDRNLFFVFFSCFVAFWLSHIQKAKIKTKGLMQMELVSMLLLWTDYRLYGFVVWFV
jgi:uncharacterized membrane protein